MPGELGPVNPSQPAVRERRRERTTPAAGAGSARVPAAGPLVEAGADEIEPPLELPDWWHPLRSQPTIPLADTSTLTPCAARHVMQASTSYACTNCPLQKMAPS